MKVLRVKDALTSGKVTPTNKAVDGQPYTSTEKVINPNKPGTTVTPTPTNGLTIDETSGKVTGTPIGLTWNGDETEQTVNIPVVITKGNETVNETIPVVVQRDLDGDGTPDVSDDDIDGDGIPNRDDQAPRVKDALTSGKVTPTNPAVDGQPYTSTEKVINPNKPGTTVIPTPTNGLTIDGTSGKVTGTPTGLTWNGDETEQTVNIPVVITKGNETINETIPVVVQRSSRNGQPETQEDISEYTKPIGTTGVDGNGNLLEPPIVDIPEYTEPIGTTGVDENGNLIAPPVTDTPEFNGGVNGDPEILEKLPEFNGGVNGEPEVQPELPEFNGGVNGEPEVQPELPEINGEVEGEEQGRGNKPQPTGKVEKSTKRLANTGEAETNTGMAGLGLAALGSLLVVAKRRREDEE